MIFRPATPADLPAIQQIQAAAPEASHWDPADYLSYVCLVAESPEGVCGFLVVRQSLPVEHEILNLAVVASCRRQGVAKHLVEQVLSIFPGVWFLEVRASNSPAKNLYYSLGFQQVGVRQNYYQDPAESAIVMKRNS